MNKNKLKPELRFPEFRDKNNWKETFLSEILYEHGAKSEGNEEVYSVSVRKGLVNQIEHLGRKYAASNTDKYKRVLPNDVIYTKSPTGNFPYGIIKQSKISKTVIVSPLYGVFTPKTGWIGNILNSYFEYPERTISYLEPIIQKGAKNTINIKNDVFLSKSLILPNDPNEQQKISNFLSNLNELIEANNEKLITLNEHKKGLLENLFPKDGVKVPKYRFKEFENDGEWQYLNGNDLFKPISNKKHNSDLPILAITQEHGAIPRDLINYNVIASASSIANYKIVEKGDYIISLRSFQGGIEYSNYKGICSPAYIVLRKKMNIHDMFFKFYFKTDLYIKFLNKNIEGIRDGKMVSYSQFSEIKLPKPSIAEQIKIASCLSEIEELINSQSAKIEQLKLYRQGITQRMFLKIDN